ncbi:hypothetical protein [Acidovorax delafieldii]|nr:hypothetical protein [Acidovorax delafieldii]
MRTFPGQRAGPSGQRLVEIVLRSRPTDIKSDSTEFLDLGGREPE